MSTDVHSTTRARKRGRKQICRYCEAERRGSEPWILPRRLHTADPLDNKPCGDCEPLPGFEHVPPTSKLARELRLDEKQAQTLRAILRGERLPTAAGERFEARDRQLWRGAGTP